LDGLEVVVIVDNETDTLSRTADPSQTSEAAWLMAHLPPDREVGGEPATTVFQHLCLACHGYSALVVAHLDGERRTALFDVGPSAEVWLGNARRLGVDLAAIGTVFLSHWHWDHSGGLVEVVDAITRARRRQGLDPPTVDLHPDRPVQRGIRLPDRRVMLLPPEPTFDDLERTGARLALEPDAHPLAGGWLAASGHIPRRTAYETGLPGHVTDRGGGFSDDPEIADERFLAARVRGRGVTVLSACSHAGIVNAATAAAAHGGDRLDLVVGGYHLAGGPMEARIADTVKDLVDLDPRLVAPGHCTGWRAKAALAGAFGPGDRYVPSVVGTRYRLAAP
jgi:7,8-dihydropterin-6-yl-methyl-4-(beta-D-ribofuranosyl)aminobenzene 5'-phosphate synthase